MSRSGGCSSSPKELCSLQASLLAVLTAGGWISLIQLYVLAAVLGTASAIDNPTRQAFVKEMVGPEDVPNAVALNSIVMNTARLIGPALGGITIAAIGVAGCFGLNAVSFVAAMGALLLMRPERFYDIPSPARGKMLAQIGEGLRYVVQTPDIALVMLLMGVIGTFGYNFTGPPAADRSVCAPRRPDRLRHAHLGDGDWLADRRLQHRLQRPGDAADPAHRRSGIQCAPALPVAHEYLGDNDCRSLSPSASSVSSSRRRRTAACKSSRRRSCAAG